MIKPAESFEKFMKNANSSKRLMVYFLPLLIGVFVLFVFSQQFESKIEMLSKKKRNLQNKIKTNISLESNAKAQLHKLQNELLLQKEYLQKNKEAVNFIKSKLYDISFATYNEKKWAKLLDRILKERVEISHLKSQDVKSNNKKEIKLKRKFQISGVGKYQKVIRFINQIERFDAMLKITKIVLQTAKKGGVNFDINFEVYEIRI
jgi:DNA repair exonuclease SbcCD ATPase subunit